MSRRPLISLLCVTHDRPTFMPWLFWNVHKQSMIDDIELVLVDSSSLPRAIESWPSEHVRHIYAAENHVGKKYQLALELAEGEAVMLWGDDDWHHPRELETAWLALAHEKNAKYAGWWQSHYLNLWTGEVAQYRAPNKRPGASSAVVRTDFARQSMFTKTIASDTEWFAPLVEAPHVLLYAPMPHVMWLCHGRNTSPRLEEMPFAFSDWQATLEPAEREVTELELMQLKMRLGDS